MPVPTDGKSKPYFITDDGRRYLEETQQRAMATELGQRQDWAATEADTELLQVAVADFLRRLPEFQLCREERIREVSQGLAESLSQSASQQR